MASPRWTVPQMITHFDEHLPLAGLLGIELVEAEPEGSLVRLGDSAHIRRPGGFVAGPVVFATADVGTYALCLALGRGEAAVTASLLINFFHPGIGLPILARAVPLRTGRRLMTFDVRIWSESDGADQLVAEAAATWAGESGPCPR